MNTVTTLEIASSNLNNTEEIAAKIGAKLKGREVIELVSDVGGGKTAFTKGLAKGAKSPDEVASPTFTISRHYEAGSKVFTIQHFDFYRLEDPGIIKLEIAEAISDPQVVTVVEWSGIIAEVLPDDRLQVTISPTGENTRLFHFEAGEKHTHLLEGLE